MKYFFSEIDGITLTFGDIETTCEGKEFIRICFEKVYSNSEGCDFLESTLPALHPEYSSGFPEELQGRLLDYARTNAFLIWELAREAAITVTRANYG